MRTMLHPLDVKVGDVIVGDHEHATGTMWLQVDHTPRRGWEKGTALIAARSTAGRPWTLRYEVSDLLAVDTMEER